MKRSALLMCLCPLLSGCPIGDQGPFYQIHGSSFTAQHVPVYHVDVSDIIISWHPESAANVVAHHSRYQSKTIWKVTAVRPVQLAGLRFNLFEAPPGFKTVIDRRNDIPKDGVCSLEIFRGTRPHREQFVYLEFSAESVAQANHRPTNQ